MGSVESTKGGNREADTSPVVLFVAYQTGRAANGGIVSLDEILCRLSYVRPLILTQQAGPATQKWLGLGLEVQLWNSLQGKTPPSRTVPVWGRWPLLCQVVTLAQSNWLVARLIRKRGVGVVHCNDGRAALSTAIGARLAGAAVVLNIRDTVLGNARKWRLLLALSSHVIVLSEEMAQEVKRRVPVGNVPLSVSYSVVDPDVMKPQAVSERTATRERLGIEPGVTAIGVVGALMAKKQQLQLLRFLVKSPHQLPDNAHLFFIGDCTPDSDDYSRKCVQTVEGSPLRNRIHFSGYFPQVRDWYCALDVTLISSAKEGLARAMIESLACGTPVVSFDCCSAREVLERHDCGRVVPMGDFAALMGQVRQLAADKHLREQLSRCGRRVSGELFNPQQVVSTYERIFLHLLGHR